jgi:hypothetical protein
MVKSPGSLVVLYCQLLEIEVPPTRIAGQAGLGRERMVLES